MDDSKFKEKICSSILFHVEYICICIKEKHEKSKTIHV